MTAITHWADIRRLARGIVRSDHGEIMKRTLIWFHVPPAPKRPRFHPLRPPRGNADEGGAQRDCDVIQGMAMFKRFIDAAAIAAFVLSVWALTGCAGRGEGNAWNIMCSPGEALISLVLAATNALSLPWLADAVVHAGGVTNGWMAPGLGAMAWGLGALFLFRVALACKRQLSAARSAAKLLAGHRWERSSPRQGVTAAETPYARAA